MHYRCCAGKSPAPRTSPARTTVQDEAAMLRNVTVAELADIEEPVALMMAIWRHTHVF